MNTIEDIAYWRFSDTSAFYVNANRLKHVGLQVAPLIRNTWDLYQPSAHAHTHTIHMLNHKPQAITPWPHILKQRCHVAHDNISQQNRGSSRSGGLLGMGMLCGGNYGNGSWGSLTEILHGSQIVKLLLLDAFIVTTQVGVSYWATERARFVFNSDLDKTQNAFSWLDKEARLVCFTYKASWAESACRI